MGRKKTTIAFSDPLGRIGTLTGLDFVILRQVVEKWEVIKVFMDAARHHLEPLMRDSTVREGVLYVNDYLDCPYTFNKAPPAGPWLRGQDTLRVHAREFLRYLIALIQPLTQDSRTLIQNHPNGVEAALYQEVYAHLFSLWEASFPVPGSRNAPTENAWNLYRSRANWWFGATLYGLIGKDNLEALLVWADIVADTGDNRPSMRLGRGDPRQALTSIVLRTTRGSVADRLAALQYAPYFVAESHGHKQVIGLKAHKEKFSWALDYFEACLPTIIDGYFSIRGSYQPEDTVELRYLDGGEISTVLMDRPMMLAYYKTFVRELRANPNIPRNAPRELEFYTDGVHREYGYPVTTPATGNSTRNLLYAWISDLLLFARSDSHIARDVDYPAVELLLYGSGDYIRMHKIVSDLTRGAEWVAQRMVLQELQEHVFACEWRTIQMLWATGRRNGFPGIS